MIGRFRSTPTIRFGAFELDLRAEELRRKGGKIPLQDQLLQVLTVLVENADTVVTRKELRERLWSPDVFVDFDHSLNNCINKLREALNDSASSPRYIETIPRLGYRFIAKVEIPNTVGTALGIAGESFE
jgi:DNA-binding winged helix-turn-helix (wHTH) protein